MTISTISGLEEASTYQIRMYCRNEHGRGPPSRPVTEESTAEAAPSGFLFCFFLFVFACLLFVSLFFVCLFVCSFASLFVSLSGSLFCTAKITLNFCSTAPRCTSYIC